MEAIDDLKQALALLEGAITKLKVESDVAYAMDEIPYRGNVLSDSVTRNLDPFALSLRLEIVRLEKAYSKAVSFLEERAKVETGWE